MKRGANFLRVKSQFNAAKYSKISVPHPTSNVITSYLSTSVVQISCIYLIKTADDLHEENNDIYKYGYTNDLKRRFSEHGKKYGADICLACHAHIPKYYLRDAENDLRNFFTQGRFKENIKGHNELVKIPYDDLDMIHVVYKNIAEKYNIQYEALIEQNMILKKILKI